MNLIKNFTNWPRGFGGEGSTEIEVDLDKSTRSSTMFSAKKSGSICEILIEFTIDAALQ